MIAPRVADIEALALDVLRHYLPDAANYVVTPPHDWVQSMPFVWIVRVGGSTKNPIVDHAVLSVSTIAATRKDASDLARKVQTAFWQARLDGFHSPEGKIADFQVVKGPQLDRDGLSGKHSDSYNFDATYDVWARAPY